MSRSTCRYGRDPELREKGREEEKKGKKKRKKGRANFLLFLSFFVCAGALLRGCDFLEMGGGKEKGKGKGRGGGRKKLRLLTLIFLLGEKLKGNDGV